MKVYSRFLYAIIFPMLLYVAANAQLFNGGIEGAITTSSVKISNTKDAAVNVIKGKDITGYKGGLFLKFGFPASPLYVKPKFLVSHQNGPVTVSYPEQSVSASFSVTRFEMPVLGGLKILGPLSIEAGPVYNHIITATKSLEGNELELKPGGFGYRIGANAQFALLGLNIAWQGIKNNSSADLSSFETPNELIFGASLSFGK